MSATRRNRRFFIDTRLVIPIVTVKYGEGVVILSVDVYFFSMTLDAAIQLRQDGDLALATTAMEEILSEHPDDPIVHFQLATTYVGQGETKAAIAHYEAAFDAGLPEHEDGHAILAYAALLRSQRKYLKAARFLQGALSRRPDDDGIRVFLALTQHKLGMHTEAVQSLVRILVSSSDSQRIRELSPMLSFYAGDIDFIASSTR